MGPEAPQGRRRGRRARFQGEGEAMPLDLQALEEARDGALTHHRDFAVSNRLITAAFKLPIRAMRLLWVYLSHIRATDLERPPTVRLSVRHLMETIPQMGRHRAPYEDVDAAAADLYRGTVRYQDERGNYLEHRWLEMFGRQDDTLVLRATAQLGSELLQLASRGHFTRFTWEAMLCFRSEYHARLYMFFVMQVFARRRFRLTIRDVRIMLSIPPEDYRQSAHFRTKVLEPAIREINLRTPYEAHLEEPIKEGRAIIGWWVRCQIREQPSLLAGEVTAHDLVDRLRELGLNPAQAAALAREYDEDLLRSAMATFRAREKTIAIKSPSAYLRTLLEDSRKADAQAKAQMEQKLLDIERQKRDRHEEMRERHQARARDQLRRERAAQALQALSADEREALEQRIVAHLRDRHPAWAKRYQDDPRDPSVEGSVALFVQSALGIPEPTSADVDAHIARNALQQGLELSIQEEWTQAQAAEDAHPHPPAVLSIRKRPAPRS